MRVALAAVLVAVAVGGFLYPGGVVVGCLFDRAFRSGGTPELAVALHRSLIPRFERWARQRIASGRATHVSADNVAGTEWPLFGSVFFLWATEALQNAWEREPRLIPAEPRAYAREAIEAAVALVTDPVHATWVRRHWGDRYLEQENVFYRMLLISALTAHHRLTENRAHETLLRAQVEGLAAELDRSPYGLLDDYPGQCYPTDVVAAIAAIRRADSVLGTDHSAFVQRSLRGFTGLRAGRLGLPPYFADATTGQPADDSRGCSNSYVVLRALELWPEQARDWYAVYQRHFWQDDWLAAGFREFPRGSPFPDSYFDVDAGPVVRGFGTAASAFGVAAARAHGRFDHAFPLSLEMVALSWPLPGGRLLLPRLFSDSADAPFLGEVCILFNLTQPGHSVVPSTRARVPNLAWLCLIVYFGVGTALLWLAWRLLASRRRRPPNDASLVTDHPRSRSQFP